MKAFEIVPIEREHASGWGQTMHVVGLGDGGVLVHSPVYVGDKTFERIDALGAPRILVAPNHYHHLSLGRFRDRYPDAIAVADEGALPRLTRKGHDGVRPLADAKLPEGMRWLVPEGTKTGEAWLALDDAEGPTWLVCDAFFNVEKPVTGLYGGALRVMKATPGLSIGWTFISLCIADRARYRRWVEEALARERPRRMLFSHGVPLVGGELVDMAKALLAKRLG